MHTHTHTKHNWTLVEPLSRIPKALDLSPNVHTYIYTPMQSSLPDIHLSCWKHGVFAWPYQTHSILTFRAAELVLWELLPGRSTGNRESSSCWNGGPSPFFLKLLLKGRKKAPFKISASKAAEWLKVEAWLPAFHPTAHMTEGEPTLTNGPPTSTYAM